MVKTRVITVRGVEGRNARNQIAFCAFQSLVVVILVPRARRFLVTWLWGRERLNAGYTCMMHA